MAFLVSHGQLRRRRRGEFIRPVGGVAAKAIERRFDNRIGRFGGDLPFLRPRLLVLGRLSHRSSDLFARAKFPGSFAHLGPPIELRCLGR